MSGKSNNSADIRAKLELLALKKQVQDRLVQAFSAMDLKSRHTPAQLEISKSPKSIKYVIGSNRSGKTAWGARETAWWFLDNHPYLQRPAKWGNGPIMIIVMGQTQESIQTELWGNKMRPFCGEEDVDYKVQRSGGYIKNIVNLHNGNVMTFMTHSDAEQARKRAQGFTAHIAWIDEMPPLSTIITEMRLRVLTTAGFMYCTFTPLFTNEQIRKIVDTPTPKSEKFRISILDNPVLTEEERENIVEEFRSISGSDAEFRTRLYGEWMVAGLRVYSYESEKNFEVMEDYDPFIWPHVVIVDPAASTLAGLLVMARHPQRDRWYAVKAKYLKGSAFSELVPAIEDEIRHFNISERVCDSTPSAFYLEAMKQGISYKPIAEKANNKENWIEDTNKAFSAGWLVMTEGSELLNAELVSCARKEDDPTKIIKSSKYHLSDCLRYFVVFKPKFVAPKDVLPPDEAFRRAWKEQKAQAQEAAERVREKVQSKESRGRVRVHRMNRRLNRWA